MMAVHRTPANVCFGLFVHVLNISLSICYGFPGHLLHGDEAAVREGKPEYLSKVAANRSETSSNSNEAFNEMKRHNSLSTSTALLVVIVSVGFMLIALFLLWRRYRFSNSDVACHYTTLNQELTLSVDDIPDSPDDVELNLDLSDTPSSDDEVNYIGLVKVG